MKKMETSEMMAVNGGGTHVCSCDQYHQRAVSSGGSVKYFWNWHWGRKYTWYCQCGGYFFTYT